MSSQFWATFDPAAELADLEGKRNQLIASGQNTPELENEYRLLKAKVDFFGRNKQLPGIGGRPEGALGQKFDFGAPTWGMVGDAASGAVRGAAALGTALAPIAGATMYPQQGSADAALMNARDLQQRAQEAYPPPAAAAPWYSKGAAFVGEAAPALGLAALAPEAAPTIFGLMGAGAGYGEAKHPTEAQAARGAEPQSEAMALARGGIGGTLGALSALPFASGARAFAGTGWGPSALRTGEQALFGGLANAGQVAGENAAAKFTGDPNRPLGEGVAGAAIGGAAIGGTIHAVGEGLRTRALDAAQEKQAAETKQAEAEAAQAQKAQAEQAQIDAQQKAIFDQQVALRQEAIPDQEAELRQKRLDTEAQRNPPAVKAARLAAVLEAGVDDPVLRDAMEAELRRLHDEAASPAKPVDAPPAQTDVPAEPIDLPPDLLRAGTQRAMDESHRVGMEEWVAQAENAKVVAAEAARLNDLPDAGLLLLIDHLPDGPKKDAARELLAQRTVPPPESVPVAKAPTGGLEVTSPPPPVEPRRGPAVEAVQPPPEPVVEPQPPQRGVEGPPLQVAPETPEEAAIRIEREQAGRAAAESKAQVSMAPEVAVAPSESSTEPTTKSLSIPQPSPPPYGLAATRRGDRLIEEGRAGLKQSAELRGRGPRNGERGGTTIVHDIHNLSLIAAGHILNGLDYAAAKAKMIAEYGEKVRQNFDRIWAMARAHAEEGRSLKEDTSAQASEPEGVRATQGRPATQEGGQPQEAPAGRLQGDASRVEPKVQMRAGETFRISHGTAGTKDARYIGFEDGKHQYEYRAADGTWKRESRGDDAFGRAIPRAPRADTGANEEMPLRAAEDAHRPALWHEALATEGDRIKRYGKFGAKLAQLGLDIRAAISQAKGREIHELDSALREAKKSKEWRKPFAEHFGWIVQKTNLDALKARWEDELRVATTAHEKTYARQQLDHVTKVKRELGFNPSEGIPESLKPLVEAWHQRSEKYKTEHEAVAGEAASGRLQDYFPHITNDEIDLSFLRNDDTYKAILDRLAKKIQRAEKGLSAGEALDRAKEMMSELRFNGSLGRVVPKPGSLEFHRSDIFGPADLDMSVGVMGKWFADAAKGITAWKALGEVGPDGKVIKTPSKGLQELVRDIEHTMELPKWAPKWLGTLLRHDAVKATQAYAQLAMGMPLPESHGVLDNVFGRAAARAGANFQYRSKLLSAAFILRNTLQPLTFGPSAFSTSSTLLAILDQFRPGQRLKNLAAVADQSHGQFEEHGQVRTGFDRATSKLDVPIRASERLNRGLSASAGSRAAETWLNIIRARRDYGPIEKIAQDVGRLGNPLAQFWADKGADGMARRRLKEIFRVTDQQIDEAVAKGGWDKVKDPNDPLGESSMDERIRYIAAHEINFGGGPDFTHRRFLGNHPITTLVRTFQQFGINAAKLGFRDIIREAAKGNFRAGIAGTAAVLGAGELGHLLNELITGPKERKSDYAETYWGRILQRGVEDLTQAGLIGLFDSLLTGRLSVHSSTIKNAKDLIDLAKATGFADIEMQGEHALAFTAKEIRAWREATQNFKRLQQEMKGSPIRVADFNRARRVAEIYKASFGASEGERKDVAFFKTHADLVRDALVNVSENMTGDEWETIDNRVERAIRFIASKDEKPGKNGKPKSEHQKLKDATDKLRSSLMGKGPMGPLDFASDDGKYKPQKPKEFLAWVRARQQQRFDLFGEQMTAEKIEAMQAAYESAVDAALKSFEE